MYDSLWAYTLGRTGEPGLFNRMKRLGRAADYSTALLQTRASAINAHGSSDYGFAESFIAVNNLRIDQRVVAQECVKRIPVLHPLAGSTTQPSAPVLLHFPTQSV